MGFGKLGVEVDGLLLVFAGQLLAEGLSQSLVQKSASFLAGRTGETLGFEVDFAARRNQEVD